MIDRLVVKTAYANIYSEPSFTSQMVTQALFFEELIVTSEHDNWYKINQWDGYTGYVHKFYLSENYDLDSSHELFISNRFELLYSSTDFRQDPSIVIPFGSRIPIKKSENILETTDIDGGKYYLKSPITNERRDRREQIIYNSKKLLGSPYLWGGKTPFGYDCSGFVQSVYRIANIDIKRDTSAQIEEPRMTDIDIESVERGDLLFFNIEGRGVDHVGIWFENDNIIHCGGELKVQSIYDDSHIKLSEHILKVRSLSGILNES